MPDIRANGDTSNILRFKLTKTSTGLGFTGLSSSSSGLIIGTIADNEASSTAYTQGGSTIETITTLGTFATPTTNKCRFKEVDATSHPGLYEFQFANARFAVSSAKRLIISVSGVSDLNEADYEIEFSPKVDVDTIKTNPVVNGGTATFPTNATLASTTNITAAAGCAVSDKTGFSLSSSGLNAVLVDGKTLPAAFQIIAAGVIGKVSGAGTGTEVFVGLDGSTTRATVTVDSSGNRTGVVYA